MNHNHMKPVSVGARISIWAHWELYSVLCMCVCLRILGWGKGNSFCGHILKLLTYKYNMTSLYIYLWGLSGQLMEIKG